MTLAIDIRLFTFIVRIVNENENETFMITNCTFERKKID